MKVKEIAIWAGVGVAGLIALQVMRKGASGAVADIAAAAGGVIGDAGVGLVLGIGDALGVPRTNVQAGQAAWAAGNYFEASKLLPAGDFLGNVWDAITGPAAKPPAVDPKLELAKQNAALYGGTVAGWYGVDYIDNDPVNMRGTSAPIASKWGTATSVGWPWER